MKHFQKNDLLPLTYGIFIELLVQVALFIYCKPNDSSLLYLQPASIVEKLLDHFKQAAKRRGVKTLLYDNPHATALADPDVIKQLTNMCNNNPDFQVPDGYKKLNERHVKQSYLIRDYFKMPEVRKICTEVLDEILFSSCGAHIIEPCTTYYNTVRITPIIPKFKVTRGGIKDLCNRFKEQSENYLLPYYKQMMQLFKEDTGVKLNHQ